jgi:hypothetical protein
LWVRRKNAELARVAARRPAGMWSNGWRVRIPYPQ